jgi:hypothetical protein
MIRGNTKVRCPLIDHLQHAIKYTNRCPEWFVLALVEASLTIKVPEQFIRAVDKMNDHEFYFYYFFLIIFCHIVENSPRFCFYKRILPDVLPHRLHKLIFLFNIIESRSAFLIQKRNLN